MWRVSIALSLVLAACGDAERRGSTATVKLPPPAAAQPEPGFSAAVATANR